MFHSIFHNRQAQLTIHHKLTEVIKIQPINTTYEQELWEVKPSQVNSIFLYFDTRVTKSKTTLITEGQRRWRAVNDSHVQMSYLVSSKGSGTVTWKNMLLKYVTKICYAQFLPFRGRSSSCDNPAPGTINTITVLYWSPQVNTVSVPLPRRKESRDSSLPSLFTCVCCNFERLHFSLTCVSAFIQTRFNL